MDYAEAVRTAIDRSTGYFLRTQHAAGYWVGELESNATISAEYVFFRRLLDRVDPGRERAVAAELLATQVDGGWPLYYGGPPDLDTTLEAAVALQLAGLPQDHPALTCAAATVRAAGGVERARVFTRIWLALLGALPWSTVPAMPPEMMLLPYAFPLNVYRFASWARGTIVPLLVVLNHPPRYAGPVPQLAPFYAGPPVDAGSPPSGRERRSAAPRPCGDDSSAWNVAFRTLDHLLKRAGGPLRYSPLRRPALNRARRWILARQEADGGWGGIIPAMVNSTLALEALDGCESAVERGLEAVEGFGILDEEQGRFRLQPCVSPGWDTPWTMLALEAAGLPSDHPALLRAARWLLAQQSTVYGDWSLRAPGVPAGGWPFEFANAQYPDTDDTAVVLQALLCADTPSATARADGLAWLLGMQNSDGGWAAFDRDNQTRLVKHIPFCDFGEVLDPSSADVTAHVLELLGRLGYGPDAPPVQRGLAYLWHQQEADGAWYGRWGVNYVYGTAAVLMALSVLGLGSDPRAAQAAAWLRAHQNDDGGWGESCRSYEHPAWHGRGPSTASQTAWALLGLHALRGEDGQPDQDLSLQAGLRWLLEHQNADGTWDEPHFTGTGFPGDFYIKYHEYRNYFPLLVLGKVMRG